MFETLWQIAPPLRWAQVVLASTLLLCGFVAYGHFRVERHAFHTPFSLPGGLVQRSATGSMARWTTACLLGGLALWGLALDWPAALVGPCGALAGLALLGEAVARLAR